MENNTETQNDLLKKPKTAKGKKIQREKEGQLVEGPKKTLFVKGNKTNQTITNLIKDLFTLKRQNSILFSKKHDIHPFDDSTLMQKYVKNYDCSIFIFGSHSKKRPTNLVIGRLFDGDILDMVELDINYAKTTDEFKQKIGIPLYARPALIFQGDVFESNVQCIKLKNLLLDVFTESTQIKTLNLITGFTHAIVFSGVEGLIKMRTYQVCIQKEIATKSDLKEDEQPIQLIEIGPNIDFKVKRENWAGEDAMKQACKQPKPVKKPGSKNITHDNVGDRKGKLFVDQQNLQQLGLRKRKNLKQQSKEKQRIQKLKNQANEQ